MQRVSEAHVLVGGKIVGQIDRGLCVLLGVSVEDDESDSIYLSKKIAELRIFEDDQGKMNRSLQEVGGGMLVVSQFTLLGDCRKGRRPSFVEAADPSKANHLYERFVNCVRAMGIPVATGIFQTSMTVSIHNEGPVTMLLDSRNR